MRKKMILIRSVALNMYLKLTKLFLFCTVENELHCDFVKLREMLIRTNMEDMREKTHCKHYELYRKKRLEQVGEIDNISCLLRSKTI